MAASTDSAAIVLDPRAAADVRTVARGIAVFVAEGEARAAEVVAAMRDRVIDAGRLDDLAAAWRAGVTAARGARLSAAIVIVRDARATIVHAGDLAVHALGDGPPRALTRPHARLHEPGASPLRIRTRALGMPGPAGHAELTEVATAAATRLAITTASVWAPLGPRLAGCLAELLAARELAEHLIERAAAEDDPLARAVAGVPRGCVVIPLPAPEPGEADPTVAVAAQRRARRQLRAVLARTVGPRSAVLVGPRGSGKSAVLAQLGRAGAIDSSARVVAATEVRRALRSGAPTSELAGVLLVDRIADVLASEPAAAGALAERLASGASRLVTTATPNELAALAAAHPRVREQLAVIELGEPTVEELRSIVDGWLASFARTHGVRAEPDVAAAVVELARRYPLGRAQPEAALFVLEQACLRAGHAGVVSGTVTGRGGGLVDRRAVCAAIADQRGIPVELVGGDDATRASELAPRLTGRLHGQADAVESIAGAVVRGIEARHRGEPRAQARPIASVLLLGPTGTGKTETAYLLAEHWFLDRRALTRIDLSEYREPASAFRLLGAPPGYIGHAERPLLAAALAEQPDRVVLFDELEKACADVQLLLLQLLDTARLTTSQGEVSDFSRAIVVLTSNLGADARSVGFAGGSASRDDRAERAALARVLRPELVERIDEVVRYAPLGREAATAIALGHLARCADALIVTGRLAPAQLPRLRQRVLAELSGRTTFPGGAREIVRAVDAVLAGERASPRPSSVLAVVYPYLGGERERLAAGIVVELAARGDAEPWIDAILTHPAGATLLYVAHAGARILALVGDAAAAAELAAAIAPAGRTAVAEGRVRVDAAGRPTGELVDRLLAIGA